MTNWRCWMNDEVDLKIEKIKFYKDIMNKYFELHEKLTHTQRIDWCQEQLVKLTEEVKKL